MSNPINPQTGLPWSDQQMAYFNMLAQNPQLGGGAPGSPADRYLQAVTTPNPTTGITSTIQGLDPYQQAGGLDWMKLALDQDVARQSANIARNAQDLTQGNDIGWINGNPTEAEQNREDAIRSNPLNAALYEQERRGFRAGPTGNEDPLMYQKLAGEGAAFKPATITPTQPDGQVSGAATAGTAAGGAPVPQRTMYTGQLTANYNPTSKQYEFTGNNGDNFSIDKATGASIAGGNYGTGNGGQVVDTQNAEYSKAGMGSAIQNLNQRIASLTPQAAQAFANFDAAKAAGGGAPGAMTGARLDVPGHMHGASDKGDPIIPVAFKSGGKMRIGGHPHWIVDAYGNPEAALTEDGQAETVKGKGGVEVIPTNPARKAAYEASKKHPVSVPGKATGGTVKTNNVISRNTTMSKEVNARVKGAKPGDARAHNGKTNNGRPPYPGSDIPTHGVTDKDAASVRKPIPIKTPLKVGPMGVGLATLPVRMPSGAVMPFRPMPGGAPQPVTQVVAGHAVGTLGTPETGVPPTPLGTFTGSQPTLAQSPPVSTGAPAAGTIATPPGGFDASGGNRVIGDATAPTARFGFDKAAPIDIAAHGATRNIPGMPGVSVAQPWKQGPRAMLTRGKFGNDLLQSYWNASGGAPMDLGQRAAMAGPGAAVAQGYYV